MKNNLTCIQEYHHLPLLPFAFSLIGSWTFNGSQKHWQQLLPTFSSPGLGGEDIVESVIRHMLQPGLVAIIAHSVPVKTTFVPGAERGEHHI